ncbi:DnaB-like helicase C-terminal domain-containing protein [Streptomyces sp. NPDC093589]|uniref:DnaB-like helicase C-terminal domain-containing protein n=1 Tax=Streptomyces sp. NPDC093589 TaxID=3366043 RepID=UPI003810DF4B
MPSSASPDPRTPDPGAGESAEPQPVGLGEAAQAFLTTPETVSTSVRSLDEALGGGLQPGRLYLVAGAQDAGGGLLATGAAQAAVFDHHKAVFYGASGPSHQDIAARVMAARLQIDYRALREGRLQGHQRAAVAELSEQPAAALLRIDDRPELCADGLAMLTQDVPGLGLIVVDRLQETRDPRRPMSGPAAVVEAAQALTHLARARHVPVLAVLDTDDGDLLAALDADVTVTLTSSYLGCLGPRADIAERDLGTVAQAAFETDLAHARLRDLPPPPFNPTAVFRTQDGQRAMAGLIKAAGSFADRLQDLPVGLRQDLRRLVADAESDHADLLGRLGGSQLGVLRDAACCPELPDTDDGRRLQKALDAFLGHALAHGYASPEQAADAA